MSITLKKKAGYTHTVSYKENVRNIGWVEKSFPTTRDAVDIHMRNLRKSEEQGLLTEIKVQPI